MPHNGPRGSPVADRRNVCIPVFRIAAATMLPAGILTETPFTTSVTVSGMQGLLSDSSRKIRRDGDSSLAIHDLTDEQLRSAERSRDTQTFVTGGEIKSLVFSVWTNQGKLVRSRSTKSGPRSQRR